jgi:carboxypeptidase T
MPMLLLLARLLLSTALAAASGPDDAQRYRAWAARQVVVEHPERYRFLAEAHRQLGRLSADRPGVIVPFEIGRTVQGRSIWAFRIRDPARPVRRKVLVFAGIHPIEWISTETAVTVALSLAEHPITGVELVVVPVLNIDRRLMVEADLLAGRNVYRRRNMNGVDLNRDYAVHRESEVIWQHILPGLYGASPAPLSQPESQALDGLLQEGFDVAISLHSFGGYIYHPWAGIWSRPADWQTFRRLGMVMAKAQGAGAYHVRQLSRWGFFFRAQGAEIDHIYAKYGTLSFLIELSRSGQHLLRPWDFSTRFRWYNPADPGPAVDKGLSAVRALVGTLAWEGEQAPRRRLRSAD